MKLINAQRTKFDKKVKHLKEIQSAHSSDSQGTIPNGGQPTLVPNRLREFASLEIFGSAKDLPQQQKPIDPFITGTNDIRTNGIRTNCIWSNSRGTHGIRDKQYTRTNSRGDKEYTGQTVYRTNSILGYYIQKQYTFFFMRRKI